MRRPFISHAQGRLTTLDVSGVGRSHHDVRLFATLGLLWHNVWRPCHRGLR